MYKIISTSFKDFYKIQNWNGYRLDTLGLIIYNFFIIIFIANNHMEWSFHPFKNDVIADKIGVQLNNPVILSNFGFFFYCSSVICNLSGLLPIIIPNKRFKHFLIPVLIWNVYTITALVHNTIQIVISIIYLEVHLKLILTVLVSGFFLTILYMKLILQVLNFYEDLNLIVLKW